MINYEVAMQQFMLFILILIRIATFISVAAIFNTANTPARFKVGLAFFVTLIVYTLHPGMTVQCHSVPQTTTTDNLDDDCSGSDICTITDVDDTF